MAHGGVPVRILCRFMSVNRLEMHYIQTIRKHYPNLWERCFTPLRLRVFALMLFAFLFLTACVPSKPPEILSATPGAHVVVTEDRVTNEFFSVMRPYGWRTILSAAAENNRYRVIFAAPGNCTTISIALLYVPYVPAPFLSDSAPIPPLECFEGIPLEQRATATLVKYMDGLYIQVAGRSNDRALLGDIIVQVLESITPP